MRPRGVTRNVLILGWVSFCTDLASEMLYPIIPLFLAGTLGASTATIGLIEGLAEGISSGLRWIGGALSDKFRRRKPFVVAGYSISAVSKPVMGLAALAVGWPIFLLGRALDRLGKSIRTSARDALIADSTLPEHRGVAFGFHRMMDSGDRSQRIRTYNFPQNRCTDHRLGGEGGGEKNFHLEQTLQGDLDPVINALLELDKLQRLENL